MPHHSLSYQPPGRSETTNAQVAFRCILALAAVVVIGTCGFMHLEPGWGCWKSFFFTMITISTVGYGDQGISPAGERFAAVLLLLGIGTATYSLSALVNVAIGYQLDWKRKMQRKVDQLQQHVVICGFGRIGRTVCEELQAANEPFVVVEREPHSYQAALDQGYLAVLGDSTDDAALRSAGVTRARGVICVINSDAENVFITLSVRELNPRAFIASRADAEGASRRVKRAGASLVISPYTTAGQTIARAVLATSHESPDAPCRDTDDSALVEVESC